MSEKRKDIQLGLLEDHRQQEDHERSSWILCSMAKDKEMDNVEGLTPLQNGKRNCRYSRSRSCRLTGPNRGRERARNLWMIVLREIVKRKALDDCDNQID
jgi:hypothetical protein